MECPNCKNTIPDVSNFCPYCTKRVEYKFNLSKKSDFYIKFSFLLLFFLVICSMMYFVEAEEESLTPVITFHTYEENINKSGCTLIKKDSLNYDEYLETDSSCSFFSSYGIIEDRDEREKAYSKIVSQMDKSVGHNYSTMSVNDYNYHRYSIQKSGYKDVVMKDNQIIFITGGPLNAVKAMKFAEDMGLITALSLPMISIILVALAFGVVALLFIVSWWKINVKLGRKGYLCLIPIYNVLCLSEDVFHRKWLGLLFLIPGVQIILFIMLVISLLQKYRKPSSYIISSIFFSIIIFAMLAFDKNSEIKKSN